MTLQFEKTAQLLDRIVVHSYLHVQFDSFFDAVGGSVSAQKIGKRSIVKAWRINPLPLQR